MPVHLSVLFKTGRGIGTETCEVDNVFPADDLWFDLDTDMNCAVMYNGSFDV